MTTTTATPGPTPAPLVRCVTAQNPSPMTLAGTNTYVVAAPDSDAAVVVDPGPEDPEHLRRLTERLNADLERTAGRVPANAEHGSTDGVAVARELVRLARILIDMRALSAEFPQVSKLAPAQPPRERIQALDALKLDFTRIRRETNRYLSVDYVLFNSAVKSVEDRDLPLLNQWKEFLGSGPG